MKTTLLKIRINDQFLLGEIDNNLHVTELKKNSLPEGKKIISWLESVFTVRLLKKHTDELHYIKTFVAKKMHPQIIDILRKNKNELESYYAATKAETSRTAHFMPVFNGLKENDREIELSVIISPEVMLFIAIITLTDNIIRQLRTQYLCGQRSKRDFYRQRKVVLTKYASTRRQIQDKRRENNLLIEQLK